MPTEVEAALLAHPAVAEAGVFGRPDPEWGEAVTAHVVLRAPAEPAELRAFAADAPRPLQGPQDDRARRRATPQRRREAAAPRAALGPAGPRVDVVLGEAQDDVAGRAQRRVADPVVDLRPRPRDAPGPSISTHSPGQYASTSKPLTSRSTAARGSPAPTTSRRNRCSSRLRDPALPRRCSRSAASSAPRSRRPFARAIAARVASRRTAAVRGLVDHERELVGVHDVGEIDQRPGDGASTGMPFDDRDVARVEVGGRSAAGTPPAASLPRDEHLDLASAPAA